MMNSEIYSCQSCKNQFTIEPEDFQFYEKVKVPPPTFCPDCRLQRRMLFRNERTLYKRKCDAPEHNEEVVSIFSPDKKQRVYDQKAWWGDGWDATAYARDIDFSRPFLEQVKELWVEVPDIALININEVDSEYCSTTEGNKNCYLVIGGDFNEDCLYATFVFNSKECVDTYWVEKCELNYETIDCIQCTRLLYSRYCEGCYDSAFLFNCRNCNNCFGCVNLVSKSYHIFNKPYQKEEYAQKLKELRLDSRSAIQEMKRAFAEHSIKYPRRFARALRSINSVGDDLEEAKNCKMCFSIFGGAENCKYCWLSYSGIKDSYDCDHFGKNSENSCDSSIVYPGSNVYFSRYVLTVHDVHYSYNCNNSSYLFGCIGVRNKQYCILNKQYSEEEYKNLIPKLIQHMNEKPYVDKRGRVFKYGEFFPPELSPFAYNETVAQEYFPLTKEQALESGYAWKDPQKREYQATMKSDDLPDTIQEVTDNILNQVIECEHAGTCNEQCSTAFKITKSELEFYRKMNLPLPQLCSNCRHYVRFRQRNPIKLWHRQCACDYQVYKNFAKHQHHLESRCPNEFETTYAPERKEIVYCESCYQQEIT